MDAQVRDLVEHLQTFRPETRLRFIVVTLDGTKAAADEYALRPDKDGAVELRISGALVRQVAEDQ